MEQAETNGGTINTTMSLELYSKVKDLVQNQLKALSARDVSARPNQSAEDSELRCGVGFC